MRGTRPGAGTRGLRRPSPIVPLACAAATFALTQSMLNPALPDIAERTGSTPAATTWLVTIFFLISAVSAPIFGRLGDMLGRRRWLTLSLGAFVVGAVVAGIGAELGSLPAMVSGRAVQGLAGGVLPLAFAHARATLPHDRLPFAVGTLSATIAIGAAVGVAVGGLVADAFGYPMIFWGSAIGGAATAVLLSVGLERGDEGPSGRVDAVGAVLLSIGVGAALLAVSEGPRWGWSAPQSVALAGLALAVLPCWVRHERRHPNPIVDLQLARRPALLRTNVASVLTGFGLFGSLVLTPQLVQRPLNAGGLGLTAAQAGLIVMPTALCNFLSAPLIGMISRRVGPKAPMAAGCLVATGCLLMLGTQHGSVAQVATWTAVLGIGTGAVFACTSSLVLESVGPAASGQAIGVNTIARSIGSSVGTQLGGIVLSAHLIGTTVVPSDRGFFIAFATGAGVCLLATLVALTIPGRDDP